jgi:hypothetical protein
MIIYNIKRTVDFQLGCGMESSEIRLVGLQKKKSCCGMQSSEIRLVGFSFFFYCLCSTGDSLISGSVPSDPRNHEKKHKLD